MRLLPGGRVPHGVHHAADGRVEHDVPVHPHLERVEVVVPPHEVGDGTVFDAQATSGDPPSVVWADEDRIRAAGADAYVSKPIALMRFVETVEGLLRGA